MAPAFVRRRFGGWMVVALVLIVSHHASAIVATWTETVSDGPLVATLTTTYFDQSDAFMHADDLQLVVQPAGGGPSAVWRGPAFAPWGPEDAIVARSGAIRLVDVTGDDEAEVLVDMYTGGAHCCAVSYLAWRARSPARYLFRGIRWGNVAPSLTDLDADGAREFVGVDDRFAYAFGPYAVAEFPARVWSLRRSGLTVTTARYHAFAVAAMRRSWAAILAHRRHGDPTTGAVAAYLANAANVGGVAVAGGWSRAGRLLGPRGAPTLRMVQRRLHSWGYRTGSPD